MSYEQLATRSDFPGGKTRPTGSEPSRIAPIPPLTMNEQRTALKQLKNKKSPDTRGIIAEMWKLGGGDLHDALFLLFNDILSFRGEPPDTWKQTVIKVLYKSGDSKLPQNYSPISIIPLLCKSFSRLLYNRLQRPDQAGVRPNQSTIDHVFTRSVLQGTADEWQVPIWTAAIEFKKAFDSIM